MVLGFWRMSGVFALALICQKDEIVASHSSGWSLGVVAFPLTF